MNRLEFASPAWMAAFADSLSVHLRTAEPNAMLTRCEVYRQAPAHLCEPGTDSVAWTCRNRRGEITFEVRECSLDDADVKNEGDYEAFRELVRFVVTDTSAEAFQALVTQLVQTGRIRPLKDNRAEKPAANWALHNAVASWTA